VLESFLVWADQIGDPEQDTVLHKA
jgi:hypothetical protein